MELEEKEMNRQNTTSKKEAKQTSTKRCERPHLSKATMDIAKTNLKQFESQADEAFLVRADMDRKLSSL